MGASSMLDQIISFADGVAAESITITLSKSQDALFVQAPKAAGIIFKISQLRTSQGGVLNDMTAQKALNEQLGK
jgi:hypothetical protein